MRAAAPALVLALGAVGALGTLGAGCTDSSGAPTPELTGDSCALYTTSDACNGDTACTWFGTGCACPGNNPDCTCSPGTCAATSSDGSSSGSGSSGAACACPGDDVCYEPAGGSDGDAPDLGCTTPASGSGDPCARIQGQGACTDSTTVTGLCVCGSDS